MAMASPRLPRLMANLNGVKMGVALMVIISSAQGVTAVTAIDSKATLVTAVNAWCESSTKAATETTYGAISTWDTSDITDMSGLFQDKTGCNPDIRNWDVGKVTTFVDMFKGATDFDAQLCDSFGGGSGNWFTRINTPGVTTTDWDTGSDATLIESCGCSGDIGDKMTTVYSSTTNLAALPTDCDTNDDILFHGVSCALTCGQGYSPTGSQPKCENGVFSANDVRCIENPNNCDASALLPNAQTLGDCVEKLGPAESCTQVGDSIFKVADVYATDDVVVGNVNDGVSDTAITVGGVEVKYTCSSSDCPLEGFTLSPGICSPPCDASALLPNSADVNDCTSTLAAGSTCTQTPAAGFVCSPSVCPTVGGGQFMPGSCTGGSSGGTVGQGTTEPCTVNGPVAPINGALDSKCQNLAVLDEYDSCGLTCNPGYELTGVQPTCRVTSNAGISYSTLDWGNITCTAADCTGAHTLLTDAKDLGDCPDDPGTMSPGTSCTQEGTDGYTCTPSFCVASGTTLVQGACIADCTGAEALVTGASSKGDCPDDGQLAAGTSCTQEAPAGTTCTPSTCPAGGTTLVAGTCSDSCTLPLDLAATMIAQHIQPGAWAKVTDSYTLIGEGECLDSEAAPMNRCEGSTDNNVDEQTCRGHCDSLEQCTGYQHEDTEQQCTLLLTNNSSGSGSDCSTSLTSPSWAFSWAFDVCAENGCSHGCLESDGNCDSHDDVTASDWDDPSNSKDSALAYCSSRTACSSSGMLMGEDNFSPGGSGGGGSATNTPWTVKAATTSWKCNYRVTKDGTTLVSACADGATIDHEATCDDFVCMRGYTSSGDVPSCNGTVFTLGTLACASDSACSTPAALNDWRGYKHSGIYLETSDQPLTVQCAVGYEPAPGKIPKATCATAGTAFLLTGCQRTNASEPEACDASMPLTNTADEGWLGTCSATLLPGDTCTQQGKAPGFTCTASICPAEGGTVTEGTCSQTDCIAPSAATTGYVVNEVDLALDSFDVTFTCATGYKQDKTYGTGGADDGAGEKCVVGSYSGDGFCFGESNCFTKGQEACDRMGSCFGLSFNLEEPERIGYCSSAALAEEVGWISKVVTSTSTAEECSSIGLEYTVPGSSSVACLSYNETVVAAVDCQGEWSTCTEACEAGHQRYWISTTESAGAGRRCPSIADSCLHGEGGCEGMQAFKFFPDGRSANYHEPVTQQVLSMGPTWPSYNPGHNSIVWSSGCCYGDQVIVLLFDKAGEGLHHGGKHYVQGTDKGHVRKWKLKAVKSYEHAYGPFCMEEGASLLHLDPYGLSPIDSYYMIIDSFGQMLGNGTVSTPFMPEHFQVTKPSKFCPRPQMTHEMQTSYEVKLYNRQMNERYSTLQEDPEGRYYHPEMPPRFCPPLSSCLSLYPNNPDKCNRVYFPNFNHLGKKAMADGCALVKDLPLDAQMITSYEKAAPSNSQYMHTDTNLEWALSHNLQPRRRRMRQMREAADFDTPSSRISLDSVYAEYKAQQAARHASM